MFLPSFYAKTSYWLCLLLCFASVSFAQLIYPNLIVELDSGWLYKNLQLIPIRFNAANTYTTTLLNKPVISLQQALKTGKVELKEFFFNGDANVKLLQVNNKSNEYIMLNSGDVIVGGKQDRMLAESKLIAPKTNGDFVDVYCIERGRWSKKIKPFTYLGNADAILRKVMDSTNNQQYIWKEIDRRLPNADALTTTWPYAQTYQTDTGNLHKQYMQYFSASFHKTDSLFAGFIAISDSAIIGCELFATPHLTFAAYNGLLLGWVHTALLKNTNGKPLIARKILTNFAHQLLSSEAEQKQFLLKHGKAFLYQNKVFHIVVHG